MSSKNENFRRLLLAVVKPSAVHNRGEETFCEMLKIAMKDQVIALSISFLQYTVWHCI